VRRFARLHHELDEAKGAADREAALVAYFRQTPDADAAWALALLSGRRPRRAGTPAELRAWAAAAAVLPTWLVEESQQAVGDLAETLAHLLEPIAGEPREWPLHRLVEERLLPLARASDEARRRLVLATWRELPAAQQLTFAKLLAGTFRPRVTVEAVARAFAAAAGGHPEAVARRLAAPWSPSAAALRALRLASALAPGERGEESPPAPAGVADEVGAPPAQRIVAVLLYAQRGEGPRSTHYCDFTFALWHDGQLVPIAKVSADVDGADVAELDRWVRRNAVERFGPVRQLRPELVFELAFDGVAASGRRKAGLTLRAPRILRWLRQGRAEEAGSLQALSELLGER
jgi:ATP-dependent DNA ligase